VEVFKFTSYGGGNMSAKRGNSLFAEKTYTFIIPVTLQLNLELPVV
jgi:hypothetical protein